MFNKFLSKFIFVLFLVVSGFAVSNPANGSPIITNEKFAVRALQIINSAQATFRSTTTTSDYATIEQLRNANLIDEALATGSKYGYYFSLTLIAASPNQSAGFQVSAVPQRYKRSGRRSFYADESGNIRGADKQGAPANAGDPLVPINCGEIGAINLLRTFHGAEETYRSANVNYATLTQLFEAGLINISLANGENCGYFYRVEVTAATGNIPAGFRVKAVPQQYGISGIRSFYIDQTSVIRGADKGGVEATADDPPIL